MKYCKSCDPAKEIEAIGPLSIASFNKIKNDMYREVESRSTFHSILLSDEKTDMEDKIPDAAKQLASSDSIDLDKYISEHEDENLSTKKDIMDTGKQTYVLQKHLNIPASLVPTDAYKKGVVVSLPKGKAVLKCVLPQEREKSRSNTGASISPKKSEDKSDLGQILQNLTMQKHHTKSSESKNDLIRKFMQEFGKDMVVKLYRTAVKDILSEMRRKKHARAEEVRKKMELLNVEKPYLEESYPGFENSLGDEDFTFYGDYQKRSIVPEPIVIPMPVGRSNNSTSNYKKRSALIKHHQKAKKHLNKKDGILSDTSGVKIPDTYRHKPKQPLPFFGEFDPSKLLDDSSCIDESCEHHKLYIKRARQYFSGLDNLALEPYQKYIGAKDKSETISDEVAKTYKMPFQEDMVNVVGRKRTVKVENVKTKREAEVDVEKDMNKNDSSPSTIVELFGKLPRVPLKITLNPKGPLAKLNKTIEIELKPPGKNEPSSNVVARTNDPKVEIHIADKLFKDPPPDPKEEEKLQQIYSEIKRTSIPNINIRRNTLIDIRASEEVPDAAPFDDLIMITNIQSSKLKSKRMKITTRNPIRRRASVAVTETEYPIASDVKSANSKLITSRTKIVLNLPKHIAKMLSQRREFRYVVKSKNGSATLQINEDSLSAKPLSTKKSDTLRFRTVMSTTAMPASKSDNLADIKEKEALVDENKDHVHLVDEKLIKNKYIRNMGKTSPSGVLSFSSDFRHGPMTYYNATENPVTIEEKLSSEREANRVPEEKQYTDFHQLISNYDYVSRKFNNEKGNLRSTHDDDDTHKDVNTETNGNNEKPVTTDEKENVNGNIKKNSDKSDNDAHVNDDQYGTVSVNSDTNLDDGVGVINFNFRPSASKLDMESKSIKPGQPNDEIDSPNSKGSPLSKKNVTKEDKEDKMHGESSKSLNVQTEGKSDEEGHFLSNQSSEMKEKQKISSTNKTGKPLHDFESDSVEPKISPALESDKNSKHKPDSPGKHIDMDYGSNSKQTQELIHNDSKKQTHKKIDNDVDSDNEPFKNNDFEKTLDKLISEAEPMKNPEQSKFGQTLEKIVSNSVSAKTSKDQTDIPFSSNRTPLDESKNQQKTTGNTSTQHGLESMDSKLGYNQQTSELKKGGKGMHEENHREDEGNEHVQSKQMAEATEQNHLSLQDHDRGQHQQTDQLKDQEKGMNHLSFQVKDTSEHVPNNKVLGETEADQGRITDYEQIHHKQTTELTQQGDKVPKLSHQIDEYVPNKQMTEAAETNHELPSIDHENQRQSYRTAESNLQGKEANEQGHHEKYTSNDLPNMRIAADAEPNHDESISGFEQRHHPKVTDLNLQENEMHELGHQGRDTNEHVMNNRITEGEDTNQGSSLTHGKGYQQQTNEIYPQGKEMNEVNHQSKETNGYLPETQITHETEVNHGYQITDAEKGHRLSTAELEYRGKELNKMMNEGVDTGEQILSNAPKTEAVEISHNIADHRENNQGQNVEYERLSKGESNFPYVISNTPLSILKTKNQEKEEDPYADVGTVLKERRRSAVHVGNVIRPRKRSEIGNITLENLVSRYEAATSDPYATLGTPAEITKRSKITKYESRHLRKGNERSKIYQKRFGYKKMRIRNAARRENISQSGISLVRHVEYPSGIQTNFEQDEIVRGVLNDRNAKPSPKKVEPNYKEQNYLDSFPKFKEALSNINPETRKKLFMLKPFKFLPPLEDKVNNVTTHESPHDPYADLGVNIKREHLKAKKTTLDPFEIKHKRSEFYDPYSDMGTSIGLTQTEIRDYKRSRSHTRDNHTWKLLKNDENMVMKELMKIRHAMDIVAQKDSATSKEEQASKKSNEELLDSAASHALLGKAENIKSMFKDIDAVIEIDPYADLGNSNGHDQYPEPLSSDTDKSNVNKTSNSTSSHVSGTIAVKEQSEGKIDLLKESSESKTDHLKESSETKNDRLKESPESKSDRLKESSEGKNDHLKESSESKSDHLKESSESKSDRLKESSEGKNDHVNESSESKIDRLKESAEGKSVHLKESSENKSDHLKESSEGKSDRLKEPSEGKSDHLKETSEGKNGQLKESSESKIDHLKEPSEGKSDYLKESSEGKSDHLKEPSEGKSDHLKETSEGKNDHLKESSESKIDRLKESSEGKSDHLKESSEGKSNHLKESSESKSDHFKETSENGHLIHKPEGDTLMNISHFLNIKKNDKGSLHKTVDAAKFLKVIQRLETEIKHRLPKRVGLGNDNKNSENSSSSADGALKNEDENSTLHKALKAKSDRMEKMSLEQNVGKEVQGPYVYIGDSTKKGNIDPRKDEKEQNILSEFKNEYDDMQMDSGLNRDLLKKELEDQITELQKRNSEFISETTEKKDELPLMKKNHPKKRTSSQEQPYGSERAMADLALNESRAPTTGGKENSDNRSQTNQTLSKEQPGYKCFSINSDKLMKLVKGMSQKNGNAANIWEDPYLPNDANGSMEVKLCKKISSAAGGKPTIVSSEPIRDQPIVSKSEDSESKKKFGEKEINASRTEKQEKKETEKIRKLAAEKTDENNTTSDVSQKEVTMKTNNSDEISFIKTNPTSNSSNENKPMVYNDPYAELGTSVDVT